MANCRLCDQNAGDMANICIPCGAKGDASGWIRHPGMPKAYFVGDLSGLTQPEREQYIKSFDGFVKKHGIMQMATPIAKKA